MNDFEERVERKLLTILLVLGLAFSAMIAIACSIFYIG